MEYRSITARTELEALLLVKCQIVVLMEQFARVAAQSPPQRLTLNSLRSKAVVSAKRPGRLWSASSEPI